MISSASICSETRMLPSSPAILLPTTPANTIQTSVGANSSIHCVPHYHSYGIFLNKGAGKLVGRLHGGYRTHKHRNDHYNPSAPIPISEHWCINSRQYIFQFSGFENMFLIINKYFPSSLRKFISKNYSTAVCSFAICSAASGIYKHVSFTPAHIRG
jgi:hypothetical protein